MEMTTALAIKFYILRLLKLDEKCIQQLQLAVTALGASKQTYNFALTISGKVVGNKRLLPWNLSITSTSLFSILFLKLRSVLKLRFNMQWPFSLHFSILELGTKNSNGLQEEQEQKAKVYIADLSVLWASRSSSVMKIMQDNHTEDETPTLWTSKLGKRRCWSHRQLYYSINLPSNYIFHYHPSLFVSCRGISHTDYKL